MTANVTFDWKRFCKRLIESLDFLTISCDGTEKCIFNSAFCIARFESLIITHSKCFCVRLNFCECKELGEDERERTRARWLQWVNLHLPEPPKKCTHFAGALIRFIREFLFEFPLTCYLLISFGALFYKYTYFTFSFGVEMCVPWSMCLMYTTNYFSSTHEKCWQDWQTKCTR